MANKTTSYIDENGVEHWTLHLEMNTDPLAVARMNLVTGGPVMMSTPTERYMQTPWQYYSKVFKERYGYYPEMEGYVTLKDESDEKSPC